MLYCCKITKRHKREKISSEQILCLFLGLRKFILKFKKFFKLGARKFNSLKHTKLFKSRFFFHFSSTGSYFLKNEKFFRVSVSWNLRNFRFLKYKKLFFSEFFLFFELATKSVPGSFFFANRSIVDV